MDDELNWLSIGELRQLFIERRLSPVELAQHVLRRITDTDGKLNAFITVDEEEVMIQARQAEQALFGDGNLCALHGIPVPIKDSIPTRGLRTTYGSLLYADLVPSRDSVVAARLREAGAIILGKTNVPEFQMVGRTKNRLTGECLNPWDTRCSAGGSSGGSAAAVAAGIAPVAIGGDDGGSIRLPSAYCGLIGVCPSAGRIPRLEIPPEGGYPGFIFQNIGPMTRRVEDAVTVLEIISGPHPSDPFAMAQPPEDWLSAGGEGVGKIRAAWVSFPQAAVETAVEKEVLAAVDTLPDLGIAVDYPGLLLETPMHVSGTLVTAHLYDFLEALRTNPAKRQLITPFTEAFLAAPRPDSGAEADAWKSRHALIREFDKLFERYDALLTPTTGRVAPPINDTWELMHPTEEYAAATIAVNLTGLCAMSIPAGFVSGMPVGLQVIAARGREDIVIRVARALETARPWAHQKPTGF